MNLYITFYNETNNERLKELLYCLDKNDRHPNIKKIYVFYEYLAEKEKHVQDNNILKYKKTSIVYVKKKARRHITFQNIINFINGEKINEIHIIANSDIYFDNTLACILEINLDDTCLALTRKEVFQKQSDITSYTSQDVWIFNDVSKIKSCDDIPIGWMGSDNRFAYEINISGYKVLNPALSINAWHFHKISQVHVNSKEYSLRGKILFVSSSYLNQKTINNTKAIFHAKELMKKWNIK